ncbi:oxidoreductase [Planosporangium thailandense]|uniref:Oxidoreductase n=1 Tax=Planosporangium thailandense TaxID=765197 RepID=A0ABX0Y8D3_9ACTN|nr:ferric reductase-like transmembrane domain-containing protein [Planosporangium thailandense]NJC73795.1 oxidoreductase [Planosporangium thailandense]
MDAATTTYGTRPSASGPAETATPGPTAGTGWSARPPAAFVRPPRPREDTRPGRWVVRLVFWAGLVAVIAPWWLDTPSGSLAGTGAVLTAAGRITGLLSAYLLLVQVLLMSRSGWLERWVGARSLVSWHRELGGFLVVAIAAHIAFIVVGYAATDHSSVTKETWTIVTGYEDMVTAVVAAALLAGIALLSIRALRRALRYELWYYLHVTSYLVLFLAYGHEFANGQEMVGGKLGRHLWIALYVLVGAEVLWGRLLGPLLLNRRHRLRVVRVIDEAPDMVSVYMIGRDLSRLDVKAGQFFRWRFLARGYWWQAHPFSLSAAPNGQWLRVTVKTVGDHTTALRRLRPGTRVYVEGPSGDFTADRRTAAGALLIAGGSGIAPIRALLEELPAGTVVIYRASTDQDLLFRRELEQLAEARGATLWYLVGSRDDPRTRHFLSPRGVRELVPDVTARDVYLCGPSGLIEQSQRTLRRLNVPRRQIHLDPFEF